MLGEEGADGEDAAPSNGLVSLRRNQCPVCFVQFTLEKNYIQHMWQAHGSRRPFRCEDCGLFLSYRSSLYNHRKIHSDRRPFACTDCGAKFRWNNSLKYHLRRAHGKEPPWSAAANKCSAAPTPTPTDEPPPACVADVVADCCSAARAAASNARPPPPASRLDPAECADCGKRFFLREAFDAHVDVCKANAILQVIRTMADTQQEAPTGEPLNEPPAVTTTSTTRRNPRKRPATRHPSLPDASPPPVNGWPSQYHAAAAAAANEASGSHETVGLDERLAQIYARQDLMMRRLEHFELWVQRSVGKMEGILAALVSGVAPDQPTL